MMQEENSNLVSARQLAQIWQVNDMQVHRLRVAGYIRYAGEKKLFDVEEAKAGYASYKLVKSGQMLKSTQVSQLLGLSMAGVTKLKEAGKLTVRATDAHSVYYLAKEVYALKHQRQAIKEAKEAPSSSSEKEEDLLSLRIIEQKLKNEKLEIEVSTLKKELYAKHSVEQYIALIITQVMKLPSLVYDQLLSKFSYLEDDTARTLLVKQEIEQALSLIDWKWKSTEAVE